MSDWINKRGPPPPSKPLSNTSKLSTEIIPSNGSNLEGNSRRSRDQPPHARCSPPIHDRYDDLSDKMYIDRPSVTFQPATSHGHTADMSLPSPPIDPKESLFSQQRWSRSHLTAKGSSTRATYLAQRPPRSRSRSRSPERGNNDRAISAYRNRETMPRRHSSEPCYDLSADRPDTLFGRLPTASPTNSSGSPASHGRDGSPKGAARTRTGPASKSLPPIVSRPTPWPVMTRMQTHLGHSQPQQVQGKYWAHAPAWLEQDDVDDSAGEKQEEGFEYEDDEDYSDEEREEDTRSRNSPSPCL